MAYNLFCNPNESSTFKGMPKFECKAIERKDREKVALQMKNIGDTHRKWAVGCLSACPKRWKSICRQRCIQRQDQARMVHTENRPAEHHHGGGVGCGGSGGCGGFEGGGGGGGEGGVGGGGGGGGGDGGGCGGSECGGVSGGVGCGSGGGVIF
ncbi:hypothetical protein GBA52_007890 [Prunus armeniaca]|nr:hypothetical protein GBA52_007890 [Prunus armeniaca]